MTLQPSTRLGHYEITSLLGSGGMGEVYRAKDHKLGRDVAIKVLREELATDPERLRRFEQEARSASALNHPNIITIHDIRLRQGYGGQVGKTEDVDFIVMEFVEGKTLREMLAAGPLPTKKLLQLATQIAEGLAKAHSAGIIHRDLKPENLMVTSDGYVKILDFGLAKLLPEAVDFGSEEITISKELTRAGVILGTVGYMSPEQVRGKAVDHRTDIFSLGTILYEMLSGQRAFHGDTSADTMSAILKEDPAELSTTTAQISPALEAIVSRCLEKNSEERFQSARDVGFALESISAERVEAIPSKPDAPSIAVLPFSDMSAQKDQDYFCEGLAEEIINVLTRVTGLRVIARTSAFAVARMGLDVREAGARLDVGSILEGSVRLSGQRVRVTAQLVTTSDGSHLWSERFDRELTDVLALEDEIAEAIAERLQVELKQNDRDQRRAEIDAEAHGLYLEGRYYFARGTPDALAQAKVCFERTIERDPNFALAFDSLAELYWYLGFFGNVPPREAFSQSTWHALRALELDDTLAETHALLGMLRKELDYNWPEVDRELRRARELNRESPLVRLRYAISGLLPHGRIDEAAVEVEAMLQSDPLSVFARWWVASMAYFGRCPERMIDEGQHMIALDPTQFLGHWVVGMACIESGAPDEAVTALERAHELSGGIPFTLGFLAYAYGRAGRRDDACRLLEHTETIAAEDYVPPSTLALGHVGLDDWDAAFDWWNQAIEVRDPLIMPIKTFPFFDPVRGDPRYRAMLRKMNLLEE